MKNDFCALSTKIKAMHADHLTVEDYNAMLDKHSVDEISTYLKQTYYAPFVSDMKSGTVHRGALEEHIEQKYTFEFTKLYSFVGHNERKLLGFLFMKLEISVLKTALGRIFGHERAIPGELRHTSDEFFSSHSNINIELLSSAMSVSDVCNACKNTSYYPVLNRAASMGSDYPDICMMLDRLFFKKLWSAAKKSVPQGDVFIKYVGMLIDYNNIMWIYRLKRFFKTPNELIYTYLIPVYYRLTSEQISAIVEASSTEEAEKLIRATKYADILSPNGDNSFIENNYKRIYYEQAKKAYKLYPETLTQVFAFFCLLMTEEENIKTIIEGIRYNISPELIRKYIYIG